MRRESKAWPYWRTVLGVCAGVTIVVVGCQTGNVAKADEVDCSKYKCVALTFDDGPSPYTDRLLKILQDNDAKATFFDVGAQVSANPSATGRKAAAGMEIGIHNGTLAIALALSPALLNNPTMAIPPAIYGFIMFFTAGVFGWLVNRVHGRELAGSAA